MGTLLSQISAFLPVFLASPTMWAGMLMILSSTVFAKTRGFFALAGSAATVALIGVLAVLLGNRATDPALPSSLSAAIDLALGILLIALGLIRLLKKPAPQNKDKKPIVTFSKSRPEPLRFVFIGMLLTVTNPTSLASYLSAAKLTVDSGLKSGQQITAMAVAGFYFVLPVLVPMVLIVLAPSPAKKFLAALNRELEKYGRFIIAAVVLVLGIYLIRKGMIILL